MKRQISLVIECGENTCANEPGHFCPFLRTTRFGTLPFCHLWHDTDIHGKPTSLLEKDGWLQRRPECKLAEACNQAIYKEKESSLQR
jgi:hypothetical protein